MKRNLFTTSGPWAGPPRKAGAGRSSSRRLLRTERLEDRQMLSADGMAAGGAVTTDSAQSAGVAVAAGPLTIQLQQRLQDCDDDQTADRARSRDQLRDGDLQQTIVAPLAQTPALTGAQTRDGDQTRLHSIDRPRVRDEFCLVQEATASIAATVAVNTALQSRDQLRDGSCADGTPTSDQSRLQDRLRDQSCLSQDVLAAASAATVAPAVTADSIQDRLRVQDGPCHGDPDQTMDRDRDRIHQGDNASSDVGDQDRIRSRDGSCDELAATVQSRQRIHQSAVDLAMGALVSEMI